MKEKKGDKFLQSEFSEIAKIISGEMSLREREEEIQKVKKDVIEKKKTENRKKIAQKEIVLEESDIPIKKVVQNIKLFEWEAQDRYEFKFENKSFRYILALYLVFVLFLAVLGQYLLMASLIALLFFIYVAGTNKPTIVTHRITARGVEVGNRLYEWFMLDNFWFSIKNGQYMLIIETKLRYPKALVLLLGEVDKDAIFILLQEKVLYKDIRNQGRIDRLNYGDYIPLEDI